MSKEKYTQSEEESILEILSGVAKRGGGEIKEVGLMPGHGFAVLSMPLRKDHWIYAEDAGSESPPMPMRMGTDDPRREGMVENIKEVARYAIRASTGNGKDMDFDPDAMATNFVIGMLGYYTPSGLRSFSSEVEKLTEEKLTEEKIGLSISMQISVAEYHELLHYANEAQRKNRAVLSKLLTGLIHSLQENCGHPERFLKRGLKGRPFCGRCNKSLKKSAAEVDNSTPAFASIERDNPENYQEEK